MPEAGKKGFAEMAGETLREAGVLVWVFGFLDVFLQNEPLAAAGWDSWLLSGWVMLISGTTWGSGVVIEVERRN